MTHSSNPILEFEMILPSSDEIIAASRLCGIRVTAPQIQSFNTVSLLNETIDETKDRIEIELRQDVAPKSVDYIISAARDGLFRGPKACYRLDHGANVVRIGSPLTPNGYPSSIPNEVTDWHPDTDYLVTLAKIGPDRNISQIMVIRKQTLSLRQYVTIGRVVQGTTLLDKIFTMPRFSDGNFICPVGVRQCNVLFPQDKTEFRKRGRTYASNDCLEGTQENTHVGEHPDLDASEYSYKRLRNAGGEKVEIYRPRSPSLPLQVEGMSEMRTLLRNHVNALKRRRRKVGKRSSVHSGMKRGFQILRQRRKMKGK